MVIFRYIRRLLFLLLVLGIQGAVIAGELKGSKNIHISCDIISGEVLFQTHGPAISGNNVNLYRDLQGFHTTSIRSMNRNGVQYTELEFRADKVGDSRLLEQVFTHLLSRKCTFRYDRENDTLNLVINNTAGLQINSHNATDLLRPIDENVSKIMLVWPGNTDLFEVDASINE